MVNDPSAPPPLPAHWKDVPHGRVLLFAPHPDDEVAGLGGVLALHAAAGDPVRVVVATDGVSGDPDQRFDPATYTQVRRGESKKGLAEVGVGDVAFWGFPDSYVLTPADIERGVLLAIGEIEGHRPDVVYLPWEHEGHTDHHALHLIVTQALDRARSAAMAFGYEVWNAMVPDAIVDVTAVVEQKRAAMLCHESQIAYVAYDHCMLGLSAYRSLVHQRGRGYGEALRFVRNAPAAPPSG
jgi:LmbE family N-acetylglucosaminyl deacetylase